MFKKFANLYVLGITGSIASGKSARCNRLNELAKETTEKNAAVPGNGSVRRLAHANYVSADLVGHQSYTPGTECYHEVVSAFGKEILEEKKADQEFPPIDRKKLGPIVFGDSEKMQLLNKIVWPAVRKLLEERIGQEAITADEVEEKMVKMEQETGVTERSVPRSTASLLIIEAALLLEMGLTDICDEVWLITVEREEAIVRIMQRDKCDETLAEKKLSSQMAPKDRVEKVKAIAAERSNCERPLHVEVLDTTGVELEQDLKVNLPMHFDGLVTRATAV